MTVLRMQDCKFRGSWAGAWAVTVVMVMFVPSAFGLADLGLACSDSPDPVRVGNNLTYSISVTNRGPDSATNVVVTDVLPASVAFVSCDVSQGSYSNDGNTVYCDLGDMLDGATAGVVIVSTPSLEGRITNAVSISADNGSGGRVYPETDVTASNRSPVIDLPGPHTVWLGNSTSFVVTVTDPDHDPVVTISNTVAPSGASFDGTNFSWTAAAAFFNSTNTITFVADDHQGEASSVVTNSTQLIVPYDGDADSLDDEWEWDNFGTLTNGQTGDVDGDDADNWGEYVAGTQPTNDASRFEILSVISTAGSSDHNVKVATEPGRQYTIYWQDGDLEDVQSWQPFGSSAEGVWVEIASESTNHVFVDDESADTSGGAPSGDKRFYKIKVELP